MELPSASIVAHPFWDLIGDQWNLLKRDAPEGFRPQTEVYLAGGEGPIPVNQAVSSPDQPWVILRWLSATEMHPADRHVLLHESQIERVEIRYVAEAEVKSTFGFSVQTAEEPPGPTQPDTS